MRKVLGLALLLVLPALSGCSALGLDGTVVPNPSTSTAPGPVSEAGWVVTATGSATPKPSLAKGTGTRPPALPPVTFLPIDPECARSWTVDPTLIPMQITPGKGSLKVSWPRQYASNYRIAAVPQPLVSGRQPAYDWTDVAGGTGCTMTTTITGLRSGTPYVVWLDAPNTGYMRDGTRHTYSGASGVVYPT
jgi:hypothetical protein